MGSGQVTAQAVSAAFTSRLRNVSVGVANEGFSSAMETARSGGFTVLVVPTILHWEDRATEWPMLSDKLEVKVDVVDTATGDTIATATLVGKSGKATFGGDHPQDLLA